MRTVYFMLVVFYPLRNGWIPVQLSREERFSEVFLIPFLYLSQVSCPIFPKKPVVLDTNHIRAILYGNEEGK